jgi:hypothetical protein
MRIARLCATEYAEIISPSPAFSHEAGEFDEELVMTTSALHPTIVHNARASVPRATKHALATGLLARWCAAHFTRPLYHRLGAFDLARSGMARELLERNATR